MSYETDTDGNMVPTPEAARLAAQATEELVARRSAAACSAWLPIETAPRDGTWFLATGCFNNIKGVSFCSWRPRDCPRYGWYVYGPFGDSCDSGPITHWMSLPSLPNDKDLARRALDSE